MGIVIVDLSGNDDFIFSEITDRLLIELQALDQRVTLLLFDLSNHEQQQPSLIHIILVQAFLLEYVQGLYIILQRHLQKLLLLSLKLLEHLEVEILGVVVEGAGDVGVDAVAEVSELDPEVGVLAVYPQTLAVAHLHRLNLRQHLGRLQQVAAVQLAVQLRALGQGQRCPAVKPLPGKYFIRRKYISKDRQKYFSGQKNI